jgi:RNA polymerase sigma-70 factor (ECF subfamily)
MGVPNAIAATGEQDEEQLLIYRAQMADRAAWDEIFQRNYRRVYVFVYARVGDQHSAEDITADTFLEAWRSIRRFTYRGVPLLSWLFQIAHNLMSDFLRKRSRLRTQPLQPEFAPRDPRDEAEQVAERHSVASALKKLTLEQQQVLVSRFIEGLSLAETAALMGKRENAIKALEFRALKSVRRFLGNGAVAGAPGYGGVGGR